MDSHKLNTNIMTSQILDARTVKIEKTHIIKKNNHIEHFVPFLAPDSSGYYIMTDILEANSFKFSKKQFASASGKKFEKIYFKIAYAQHKNPDEIKETNNDENENEKKVESYNIKQTNMTTFVLSLNKFLSETVKRLKHIMHIPPFRETNSFGIHINTIRLGKKEMYRNIVEYDHTKNNLSVRTLIDVFRVCSCRGLFKINGMNITDKLVYLNIRLVRLYPISIDALDPIAKNEFLRELNSRSSDNVIKYSILTTEIDKERLTKDEAKNKLMSIFNRVNNLHI